MPNVLLVTLHLDEANTKKVLVDFEDSGDYDSDREVLLDERIVQGQVLFYIFAVVVPYWARVSALEIGL